MRVKEFGDTDVFRLFVVSLRLGSTELNNIFVSAGLSVSPRFCFSKPV